MEKTKIAKSFVFVLMLGVVILGACSPEKSNEYDKYYTELKAQPIILPIKDIKFISSYAPRLREPNVEHLLYVQPEQMIHKWAQNNLETSTDKTGIARFLIKNASIVKTVEKNNTDEYEACFDIVLQILDKDGRILLELPKEIRKTAGISKNATQREKKQLWLFLTYDLIARLNYELKTEWPEAKASLYKIKKDSFDQMLDSFSEDEE